MKRIVCLWGGPGTGKSTVCAGIFNLLKKSGYSSEMNREYAKDWVWEDRSILDGDQTYIFAKQARKERLYMKQGIDFIVTDSPMALSIVYGNKYDSYEKKFQACTYMLKQHHQFCKDHGYKVDHFFLKRSNNYDESGRLQTEEQAKLIDNEILEFLDGYGINYTIVARLEDAEQFIFDKITNYNGR